MSQNKTVVVLGASSNPERYSYKAIALLLEKGDHVIPIHPKEKEIQAIFRFVSPC